MNDAFSNLKLDVFIISGFICGNRYAKQVALINHKSSYYSTKNKGEYVFPK